MNSGVSAKRRKRRVALSIASERIEMEMELLRKENMDPATATISDMRAAGLTF